MRIGDFVGVFLHVRRDVDRSFGALGPDIYGGLARRAAVERGQQLARPNLAIVLEGATGTGKERLAQAVVVDRIFSDVRVSSIPERDDRLQGRRDSDSDSDSDAEAKRHARHLSVVRFSTAWDLVAPATTSS